MTLRRIVKRAIHSDRGEFRSGVVLSCGHAVEYVCAPATPSDPIVYVWDRATPGGEMECPTCERGSLTATRAACGDIEAGAMVVECECGALRQSSVPHGWTWRRA